MGTDLNIGHATAYAYAKSKGYTGTEEQFATELAQFAQNAQQVAEDRAAVEQLVDEFLNTTAPAVIQDVTDEGTSQVERVAGAGTAQVTRVGQAGNTQIDAVAAAGTAQIGLVTAEGTTQVTRVQDKGDEVIDSIPADYTALTQEVSDLNQAIDLADDNIFQVSKEMSASATSAGWRLNESDGLCSSNNSYKLVKYSVTAGDVVKVVSDDRFQFQNASSVPSSGANKRVGKTYQAGTFVLEVPETATYLIISTPTESNAHAYSTLSVSAELDSVSDTVDMINDITIVAIAGDAVEYTDNEEGGYWRFINGAWQKVKTSGTAYNHMVTFPVEGGKSYRVTGRHGNYFPVATYWTDESTVPIGCSQDGYAADQPAGNVTIDIKVPDEATKIIVTAFPLATFPTVNELEYEDAGIVYTDAFADTIKFLKTTGYHIWDRYGQPIKYTKEGTKAVVTFGYQFYVAGTTSSWVRTITLNSDSSYTKTVIVDNAYHIVYNPTTNDIETKTWANMESLSSAMSNYVFLGTNVKGHLLGPISAIELRDLSERFDAATYPLPYYYHTDDYIEDKIEEIEDACAFINGIAFPFITDIHLRMNAKQSGKIIKYIGEHTNAVPFVISGGDIPYATDTEENTLGYAKQWLEYMTQWGKDKTIQVHGNHDYMCNLEGGWSFRCTVGQLHYYIADNESLLERPVGALYGYYDVPNQDIRIIITDDYDTEYNGNTWASGAEGYSQEQLTFIKDAILAATGDVLVVSHQTSDSAMANYITDQSLQTMLIAAKNKTGDFSAWTGDIIMHLSGHSHKDESHVEDNLLSVATVCDAAYSSPSGYTRSWGTITEQAFDVVCIDKGNKTIEMVRIGAGVSRSFTY